MPSSPKFDSQPFLYDPQSNTLTPIPIKGVPFRRPRRLPILLSFPLSLILLYLLLPSWLDQSSMFRAPAMYLSHAGKSALETTIELPRIQYRFENGKGGQDVQRRDRVKEVIERTWEVYCKEAWGWDEPKPVYGGGRDTRYVIHCPLNVLCFLFSECFSLLVFLSWLLSPVLVSRTACRHSFLFVCNLDLSNSCLCTFLMFVLSPIHFVYMVLLCSEGRLMAGTAGEQRL